MAFRKNQNRNHLVRNTCSSNGVSRTTLENGPEWSDLNLLCPYIQTLARPPDSQRAQVYTGCRSSLSCRAEVLDGQAVMFGRRGVRGSAELSALVLWKAEDDPVEYEAVDGGEEHGRVGAET